MKWRCNLLLVLIILSSTCSIAQINIGAKIGISTSLGTHVNRFGILLGTYSQYNFIQLNILAHGFYCLKNYGSKNKGWELQLTEHMLISFGKQQLNTNEVHLFNTTSNMGNKSIAIGYGLKQYFDQSHTSQYSAMFSASYKQLSLATENDAFLFSFNDKFRTGTLLLRYEFESNTYHDLGRCQAISLKSQLYTGNTLDVQSKRISDSNYPSRYGYWDMEKVACANCSHGIFMLEYETSLPLLQNAHVQIGIDDERIRNTMQNKWIHDMPFIPRRYDKAKNPHVPMLQENGKAYLFKTGEKIRNSQPFFQFGLNNPLFY